MSGRPPEFGAYPSDAPKAKDEATQQILDQQQMKFLARNVKTLTEKKAVLLGIEEIADATLRAAVKDMLLPLLPVFPEERET